MDENIIVISVKRMENVVNDFIGLTNYGTIYKTKYLVQVSLSNPGLKNKKTKHKYVLLYI